MISDGMVRGLREHFEEYKGCRNCIHQPERKTGQWVDFSMSIKGVPTEACGECGTWSLDMGKRFCPNCGADMRGEEE